MAKSNHTLVVITAAGEVTYTSGKADLKTLQTAVGGYIATAELQHGIEGYVDDEGLLKAGFVINETVSLLSKYRQTFVGTWAGNLTDRQVAKLKEILA